MDEHIEYTEPLTGTIAEAAQAQKAGQLGVPFAPLAQVWQVNPQAEEAQREEQKNK